MKSNLMKAGRLKAGGMLFILSGVTWFVAAALGEQYILAGVGVAYLCIGATFIAKSKNSTAS